MTMQEIIEIVDRIKAEEEITMTAQSIRKFVDKVKNALEPEVYLDYGIRTQEQPFDLGPIYHQSLAWIDGDETDEVLDGVCATSIDAPEVACHTREGLLGRYHGNHVAILACDYAFLRGEDPGEIIMQDASVIAILK